MAKIRYTHDHSKALVKMTYAMLEAKLGLTTSKLYSRDKISHTFLDKPTAEKVKILKDVTTIIATADGIVPDSKRAEVLKSGVQHYVVFNGIELKKVLVPVAGDRFKLRTMLETEQMVYNTVRKNIETIFNSPDQIKDKPIIYVMAEYSECCCIATPNGLRKFASEKLGQDCSRLAIPEILDRLEEIEITRWYEMILERKPKHNLVTVGSGKDYEVYTDVIYDYLHDMPGVEVMDVEDFRAKYDDLEEALRLWTKNPELFEGYDFELPLEEYTPDSIFVMNAGSQSGFYEDIEELESEFLQDAVTYVICRK